MNLSAVATSEWIGASATVVVGLVLAIAYRLGAIHEGSFTPEWMREGAPAVNPWLYALGVGAVTSGFLYLAYFALRLLGNVSFGLPMPEERSLPFGFGAAILPSLVIALAVRFGGSNLPVLAWIQPQKPALVPIFDYAGRGALIGLVGAILYVALIRFDNQEFFLYHALNWWAFDVGFYLGAFGWLAWRVIDKQGLQESVYLSVRTSAMVCWLFVGSWTFSSVFSYLGGHDLIEHWVLGMDLTPVMFLIMAQLIIFLLGWPLEWSEILIIFVPIFLPMLDNFGVNPYFFAMLVALNLQTSFLTPPMAMSAYYLKGVLRSEIELVQIFKGIMPYLGIVILCMVLMYLFPEIALWLPDALFGEYVP